MIASQFVLTPLLGWPWLGALAVLAAAATAPALWRRAPGGVWRGLGFLVLLALLAGPGWLAETAKTLPDIAVLVVDRSQSMALGDRAALAARAAASLRASAAGIDLRVLEVPPAGDGGTALFAALRGATAAISPARLAGVVAITDGEVADPPPAWPAGAPLTVLLTGAREQTDRELRLLETPRYGLVGETVALKLEVLDHGAADAGAKVPVTVTEDGAPLARLSLAVGVPAVVGLPVRHAGVATVALSAAPLPEEVSALNDQAVFTLNGVERRFNILLVSGSPDLGERSWRLLLKSDPAVRLVHFTILRTPGEMIDADPADLALVPFPVQQLFESEIGRFDLIILDRFSATGLLPERYLADIASYVENGGALLAELGPEFASGLSLADSPLGGVLPATPVDPGTITAPFSPQVTALGARDPVTAPFAGLALSPWYRMEAASRTEGDVLMTGVGGAPLLILGPAGKGRVGALLSDQFWLWTRGGSHAGPALPLLRRIVHWLLREPALEAEGLSLRVEAGRLVVSRRTLAPGPPGEATVTAPDGTVSRVALTQKTPGLFEAAAEAPLPGVWKVTEGGLTAYAAADAGNAEEYQDLAVTASRLAPLASRVVWLGREAPPPLPALIRPRHATEVTGARLIPLAPPLPAMLLALGLLAAAWWREGRARPS